MAESKNAAPPPQKRPKDDAGLAQKVLSWCGGTLIFAGAGCLIYAAYMVARFGPYELPVALKGESLGPITTLALQFSGPVVLLVAAVLGIVLGAWIMGRAIDVTADVIPQADRNLLDPLISAGDEKGVNQYVRVAALSGLVGFFTKLGFTGLPLVTAALGVLLIFLAMVASSTLSEQLMDLAKLVIGAFIGSFVQRKAARPASDRPEDNL